jgi:hypothetical protein
MDLRGDRPGARLQFGLQVAIEHGLHGLPDMKGFQRLHIGRSIEEDDAFDKLVCMLHLFNRFLAPRLGQHFVAPIVEQTVMQPVLVYRGELVSERSIEVFDNFFIAHHALLLFAGATRLVLLSGRLELDAWLTRWRA